MWNDLFWRENIAVANTVLLACLTLVFARHVVARVRESGLRSLWDDQVSQGAVALGVMNFGDCLYRAWVWAILKVYNDGQSNVWVKDQWPFAMAASVLIVIGALCAIRVFSPGRLRHCMWIGAAVATALALVLNQLL